jgi:hypothetical protein
VRRRTSRVRCSCTHPTSAAFRGRFSCRGPPVARMTQRVAATPGIYVPPVSRFPSGDHVAAALIPLPVRERIPCSVGVHRHDRRAVEGVTFKGDLLARPATTTATHASLSFRCVSWYTPVPSDAIVNSWTWPADLCLGRRSGRSCAAPQPRPRCRRRRPRR